MDQKLALIASSTEQARNAEAALRDMHEFVPLSDADIVVALGGDGHMLQLLHQMLEMRRILPVYGMNLGTVGFLMNAWNPQNLLERIDKAKTFAVKPLDVSSR